MEARVPTRLDSHGVFANIKGEAGALEELLYFSNEPLPKDELFELLSGIEGYDDYIDYPVTAKDGMVLTAAVDLDEQDALDVEAMLAPNSAEGVFGMYKGLAILQVTDPVFGEMQRVFHAVETGEENYFDDFGNLIEKKNRTYITAADSFLTIEGVNDAHSFAVLEKDGFSADIDRLIFNDEETNENGRFHILAKMFTRRDTGTLSAQQLELDRQRLSYLNGTEYMQGLVVHTKFLLHNLDDYPDSCSAVLCVGDESEMLVHGVYVEQGPRTMRQNSMITFDNEIMTLYIRGFHPEYGPVVVPYGPGLVVERAFQEET